MTSSDNLLSATKTHSVRCFFLGRKERTQQILVQLSAGPAANQLKLLKAARLTEIKPDKHCLKGKEPTLTCGGRWQSRLWGGIFISTLCAAHVLSVLRARSLRSQSLSDIQVLFDQRLRGFCYLLVRQTMLEKS